MSADSLLNLSPSRRSSHLSTPYLQKREIRRGITTSSAPSHRASTSLHRTPDSSLSLPFLPLGSPTLASPSSLAPDSIPIDSLPLTIPAEADSVVTDSVVTASLSSPPRHSYWFVPDSLTTGHTQVMVIDSTFQHLRARPHIDTTYSDIEDLIPARLEQPDSSTVHRFPQQVITVPKGGYRSEYLQTWKQQQEQHLQPHYCQIYPFPLETLWRTTAMH